MTTYRSHIVGLYPTRAAAAAARGRLFWRDIEPEQVRIVAPGTSLTILDDTAEADLPLRELLRDAIVGGGVGIGLALIAVVGLAAMEATLLTASAWSSAVLVLALGAGLGLPIGMVAGSLRPTTARPSPIDRALTGGQYVLLVQANGEAQASMVRELLDGTGGAVEALTLEAGRA